MQRLRSVLRFVTRLVVRLVVFALVVAGLALAALESRWGKNQLRAWMVRQANQYLTASLEIGDLSGSLFQGIALADVRVSRDGRTLISIDRIAVSYSIRELIQPGVVIKRARLVRPRIALSRQADGRWDLSALVKREVRREQSTGPGRPFEVASIEITDGTVTLSDDVAFGAAHIPTRYEGLDARVAFKYQPVQWVLDIARIRFRGSAPTLTMNELSGRLENTPESFAFRTLNVNTARSAFTIVGSIDKGERPTALDLRVHAPRFAFQEWGGVLHGLKDIAVDAAFDVTLQGPPTRLETSLGFQSDGGNIRGHFALNTRVPGWLGQGQIEVERINLAKWLNRAEKVSDITGRLGFDLAFGFGEHFPRGTYTFDGPHAMYMNYAGDSVHAMGRLVEDAALIAEASAVSYGAHVRTTNGSIGLHEPFPYRFAGDIAALDLRSLPPAIPVPHVQSTLALTYDVHGTFTMPFIAGSARFGRSTFLGATIHDGSTGFVDTEAQPISYGGDIDISAIDLESFGEGLVVDWMKEPKYAGTVSGRFHVDGSGSDRQTLRLAASGRLGRASLFNGRFTDAQVTLDIADGTLAASFDGQMDSIQPSVALGDNRFDSTITGDARVRLSVRDLLRRSPQRADYDADGTVRIRSSVVRGIAIDAATLDAAFRDDTANIRRLDVAGPAIELTGNGVVALAACKEDDRTCGTTVSYDIVRADLEQLAPAEAGDLKGLLAATGCLTGPLDRPHVTGTATLSAFVRDRVKADTVTGTYDVTTDGRFESSTGRVDVEAAMVSAFGAAFEQATGKAAFADGRTTFDLQFPGSEGRSRQIVGETAVDLTRRQATIRSLDVSQNLSTWRLAMSSTAPVVSWTPDGFSTTAMTFNGPSADQQVALSGSWRKDGNGRLRVVATHVVLDTLPGVGETPARYGGVLNADAIVRGTLEAPIVEGRIEVTDGRIRRFAYQRLTGQVNYVDNGFAIDLRLDQSPTTWIAAKGTVPGAVFDRERPEAAIDVAITSSPIGLGLLEGLTDVVTKVSGEMRVDVRAVGTSRDPHFQGTVILDNAAFAVASSGSQYRNGHVLARLSLDRVDIDAVHLEDASGRALELHGSLGTHELRVGDLSIDATARHFEVLRNEFGKMEVDADLKFRGKWEAPQVVGDLSITTGTLNVDAILERTLLSPYSTTPLAPANLDVISALNPWDRLAIDLSLHIPQDLRLVGEDLQVAKGTPIGLGDVNLRVGGDLYLYKDQNGALSVTGSLDRVSGTYSFQGRRFDIDERGSSINFRGDLNPELYVQVTRDISGVQTRVAIIGDLHNPELHLSSTPPLEPSDILALIVFNAPSSALSAPQQQELAVRAATIAAGFFAKPIVSAIERSLGLDILEIEANDSGTRGTRVTIGEEIAPGLVARFSRQFGQDEFNEAIVEYTLSRLLRVRATFSDATSATIRSPFRRVERAGIDLLLFFSF